MGLYDFYKLFCVCPGTQVYIGMLDLNEEEVGAFPVFVFNVDVELIGKAHTKEEYITIWNSDEANRAVGRLSGLIGPFSFTLTLIPGQDAPPYVIGDSDGILNSFCVIDSAGNFLIDSAGNFITYSD